MLPAREEIAWSHSVRTCWPARPPSSPEAAPASAGRWPSAWAGWAPRWRSWAAAGAPRGDGARHPRGGRPRRRRALRHPRPGGVRPRWTRWSGSSAPSNQLVNNAAGNFLARLGGPLAQRLQLRRADRALRHVPLHARGGPPLDRARAAGRDPVHRHELRRDGLRVRGALGRGQGGRAGPDAVAGGGVGHLRHPPQRDRPRPLPHRGRVQPAHARIGDGAAGPPAGPVAPVRRALGADQPGRLPHERRQPLPDRRPRHHRRRRGPLLRAGVRGPGPPRPRRRPRSSWRRSSRRSEEDGHGSNAGPESSCDRI